MYQTLCRAEWLCLLRTKASDITHALTQDTQRVGSATQQLLQLMGTVTIAGVYIAVSFLISVPMTLFALACGGCFLLLLRPLNRKAHGAGEDLRKSMTKMYSEVNEHLGGLKVARSLGLDEAHQANFRETTRGITRQMVRFTRVNATTRMGYEMGAAVVLAGFFYVSLEIRRIPAANLVMIVFLFARLLPRFSSIQQSSQK
jgi:ATP-binding cassette, subfamily C, bacterial